MVHLIYLGYPLGGHDASQESFDEQKAIISARFKYICTQNLLKSLLLRLRLLLSGKKSKCHAVIFGSSYRPHVALLKFPSFGGVHERPPDSQHGQAVAAVLPASEVLLEEMTET